MQALPSMTSPSRFSVGGEPARFTVVFIKLQRKGYSHMATRRPAQTLKTQGEHASAGS
jgi:hypothetical protein